MAQLPGYHARKRLIALALDVSLLPLALAVVLVEDVLWRAAQKLIGVLERAAPVRAFHVWIGGLPAAAILPLFLVPEAISHAAGFFSAYLLARGKVVAAVLLLVLVKGTATLAVVWIYQAASATLLAVGWFARLHAGVQFVRDWSLSQVAPLRQAFRLRIAGMWSRLAGSGGVGNRVRRRFRMLRQRLLAMSTRLRMMI